MSAAATLGGRSRVKPKFHYADFSVTSVTCPRQIVASPLHEFYCTDLPETSPADGKVAAMGTSRVCRGRHGKVDMVEFGRKKGGYQKRQTSPLKAGD